MNKTIFIVALVIVTVLGGSYLIIMFNPQLKSNPLIKPIAKAYGLIEEPIVPKNYNAVFCIFDPSGSGRYSYSVPTISTDFINKMITTIEDKGYGDVWLTFIARSALKNEVLHFSVLERPTGLKPPVRKVGQRQGEYDREFAKFRADSAKNASQMAVDSLNYIETKQKFLNDCNKMIIKGYAPKKAYEDYSDIIGSLNAGLRCLATVHSDSTHFKTILLISDGVQDVPAGDPKQKLNEIPADVTIITVNHSGSPKNIVSGKSIEIDNLNRALEKAIQTYKPKNE